LITVSQQQSIAALNTMAPPPLSFTGSSAVVKELQATVAYVAYELMISQESMSTTAQYTFLEKKYLGDGSGDLPLSQQAVHGLGIFEGLYESSVPIVTVATVSDQSSAVTLVLKPELHCEIDNVFSS
jgi:hypothetical protein